jgi:5-methylcytosine-specific restriction protein A
MRDLFSADDQGTRSGPFEVGHVYHRRGDLHAEYGGQQQGGISTPANYPLIFLFTSDSGSEHGYTDEFRPDGTFWYTGEGRKGDMQMKRGNKAVRDHRKNGQRLHLFEGIGEGKVRYVGRAFYLDHHWEERPDTDGDRREAIVFELEVDSGAGEVGSDAFNTKPSVHESKRGLYGRSLPELREIALTQSRPSASAEERKTNVYHRSEAIKTYARKRANGTCEGCEEEAPFIGRDGHPYLEVHHIHRVSDGGPDHPGGVIALCPNCHRRVHYGQDGDTYNEMLAQRVVEVEEQLHG